MLNKKLVEFQIVPTFCICLLTQPKASIKTHIHYISEPTFFILQQGTKIYTISLNVKKVAAEFEHAFILPSSANNIIIIKCHLTYVQLKIDCQTQEKDSENYAEMVESAPPTDNAWQNRQHFNEWLMIGGYCDNCQRQLKSKADEIVIYFRTIEMAIHHEGRLDKQLMRFHTTKLFQLFEIFDSVCLLPGKAQTSKHPASMEIEVIFIEESVKESDYCSNIMITNTNIQCSVQLLLSQAYLFQYNNKMKYKTRRQGLEDSKSRGEQIEITMSQQAFVENESRRNPNVFQFSNSVVSVLEEMSGFSEDSGGVRALNAADFMRLMGGKRVVGEDLIRFREHFRQLVKSSLKEYQADQFEMMQAISEIISRNIQQKILDQYAIQYTIPYSLQKHQRKTCSNNNFVSVNLQQMEHNQKQSSQILNKTIQTDTSLSQMTII